MKRFVFGEFEYWQAESVWYCQCLPELWREGYTAETFECDREATEMLEHLTALATAAKIAMNYMVWEVVACHGMKCREPNCESCFDEATVEAFVAESRAAHDNLKALL